MKKNLLFSLLSLSFVGFATTAQADVVKMTSGKTGEVKLSLTVSAATTASVDWGNGTPVVYTITETDLNGNGTEIAGTPTGPITITTADKLTNMDCSGLELSALDLTGAENLIKVSFNNNKLTDIDLSKNIELTSLHAEINEFDTLNISKLVNLRLLYCNNNKLENLDISNNLALTTANFNNNLISSIDFSKNVNLTAIYGLGNKFESVDLSKNTALTYISFNTNPLKSIDVTELTKLKSLFLMNTGTLSEIIGADNLALTGTVSCPGGKMTLATLPQPGGLKASYNYIPQAPLAIADTIALGEALDLSAQNNVQGILAAPVATTYSWATISGTALVVGVDYTEANGVFTFLKVPAENIVCSMTTAAFPKFTGDKVFTTTAIKIKDNTTGINNESVDAVKISTGVNSLTIANLNGGEVIKVYALNGAAAYTSVAANSELTLDLASGIYIVQVDGVSYKAIVK